MTLVELVIAIVIIGIACAALYSAMASITGRSADPMLRQQSLSIAEAYLEEIELQAFADPDGLPDCGRTCFDDVNDYHGLSEAPRDANGNALSLSDYGVTVSVTQPPAPWNGLPSADVRYIQVTVRDPAGQDLVLGGYRTRYL
jgi:MSHA pilin protein MshD